MKEAVVEPNTNKVRIVDAPVPEPNEDQVRIRVVVSGSNPKDWKHANRSGKTINQGDDIAGVVDKVGARVTEFKPGDRVAAFHEMGTPHGSFAEYAIAWQHTTFHIPRDVSFEEAATLPLAAMTAAVGLYQDLGLPAPWRRDPERQPDVPLIIYGASSAVGAFAAQLARRSGLHPLLLVAGRSSDFVRANLADPSRGDVVIDYRDGDEAVVRQLQAALGGRQVFHAFDAVGEGSSTANIARVLSRPGTISMVLKPRDVGPVTQGLTVTQVWVGCVHENDRDRDFGYAFFRLFSRGLAEGWFKPHPHQVVKGGLAGVEGALRDLKEGKASAVKFVFRIADTEGVAK